jgi:hypothetical protein
MMRTFSSRGMYSGGRAGSESMRSLLASLRQQLAGDPDRGKRPLVRQLPSWFPLGTYSSDLTARGWLMELGNRFAAEYVYPHTEANFDLLIVNPPTHLRPDTEFIAGLNDWARLGGVRVLPAYDAAYIALFLFACDRGRKLLRDVSGSLQRDARKFALKRPSKSERWARAEPFTGFVGANDVYSMVGALSGIPVTVDVRQDDKSLVADFRKWLRSVRSVLGRASRPYAKQDFAAWKKYCLLETFDLTLWSEIQCIRYTDKFLAETLWPKAQFDGVERLRKVTRPKLREMLRDGHVLQRLYRQAELQYLR